MGFRTDGQPESLLSTGKRGHLWESRQVCRVCVAGASIPACTCHDGEALRNLDDMIGLRPPPWEAFLRGLFMWWCWTKEFILAVVWEKDRTWGRPWSNGRVSLITEISIETKYFLLEKHLLSSGESLDYV